MSDCNKKEITNDLHTIVDFLRWAMSQFNEADLYYGHGTDNAWDEAVNLVLFALNLPDNVDDNLLHCRITQTEKHSIIDLIKRRINERIPSAYLTNRAKFAELLFYVDERVLVPRSPIAELIGNKFTPFIDKPNAVTNILDLCTGGGCIAIACAYAFENAEVDAVDLSDDALDVTIINIEHHDLNERVIPINSNLFSSIPSVKYDLIVTNPPYVDGEDMVDLPQEFLFEPQMGLACGEDGLDLVRDILAQAADHLSDNGILVCEVGNSQVHVEKNYPSVPFRWVEFERGGHGVFVLTKAQLEQHASDIKQQVKQ